MSRLYLIEDHLLVREGLRAMLESAGHKVVGECSDPTPALADLSRLVPDVLLLDLSLAGRSGFEVLAEVQRRGLRIRSIVLTISAQSRHVAEALRLGAAGYVLKTAPIIEVTKAIEVVLQGRRYLGSAVTDLAAQALTDQGRDGNVLDHLSPREQQIIMMVVKGLSSAAIGGQLHLAAKTVDTYRSRLMAKLGVDNIASLVRFAIRCGLIDADER
jgi:Response regulator containing a CheY-like receiver domain and an HTH DNA-binding domain